MGGAFDAVAHFFTQVAAVTGLKGLGDFLTTGDISKFQDSWGYAWDEVINPILEPVMCEVMHICDEEVISAQVSIVPAYQEKMAFNLDKNVYHPKLLFDKDLGDTFKEVIIGGRFADSKRYYAYGRDTYVNGLPTITSTAISIMDPRAVRNLLWDIYLKQNGLTDIGTSPPIRVDNQSTGVRSYSFIVKEFLYRLHGYDSTDLTVTTSVGKRYVRFYTMSVDAGTNTVSVDIATREERETTSNAPININYEPILDADGNQRVRVEKYTTTTTITTVDGVSSTSVTGPSLTEQDYIDPEGDHTEHESSSHTEEYTVTTTTGEGKDAVTTTEVHTRTVTVDTTRVITYKVFYKWWFYTITDTLTTTDEHINDPFFQMVFTVTDSAYQTGTSNRKHYTSRIIHGNAVVKGSVADPDFFDKTGPSVLDVLPIVPIKQLRHWVNADDTSEEYRTSKRLLKIMGVELDTLIQSIKDSDASNGNNIQTAGVRFGVDLNTTNKEQMIYLFKFFTLLGNGSTYTPEVVTEVNNNDNSWLWDDEDDEATTGFSYLGEDEDEDLVEQASVIEEVKSSFTVKEGLINTNISFGKVTRTTEEAEGKAGDISTNITMRKKITHRVRDTLFDSSDDNGESDIEEVHSLATVFSIEYFITDNTKIKLVIDDLGLFSIIDVQEVGKTAVAPENPMESVSIVPIVLGVLNGFSPYEKEAIVSRSAHLIIYTGTIQEIEWYQTSAFMMIVKLVLIVVAVILSFFTAGAAATPMATLIAVLTNMAIGIVIVFVLQKIAESMGADSLITQILVVVVAVVAIYYGMSGPQLSLADSAIMAVSYASTALVNVLSEDTAEIYDKIASLEEKYKTRSEEIKEAMKLFNPNEWIESLQGRPLETPEMFYTRTLNMDPGNAALDSALILVDDNTYMQALYA